MSATSAAELVRLPARPAAVDRLPDALRDLWRNAGGEDAQRSRALTINFVGFTTADTADELTEAAERLMRRSPARAFLLVADDGVTAPGADVAAAVRHKGQNRDVLQETIRLRFPRTWFPHVPGIVRPLLVNDLPSHLFWATDWTGTGAFDALQQLCDRATVDSRRFTVPGLSLPAVEHRRDSGTRITDLSWLRLRPWRRALAEAFERATWRPGTAITGIVRHGNGAAAAAILLGQWLEQRLGARIDLEESAGEGLCPDAVELRFLDTVVVAQRTVTQRIEVAVSTEAQCFLPFQVPRSAASDGDLLAAAIDIA